MEGSSGKDSGCADEDEDEPRSPQTDKGAGRIMGFSERLLAAMSRGARGLAVTLAFVHLIGPF